MSKNFMKDLLKASDNPYATILSEGSVYDNASLISTGNYMLNAQISGSLYGGYASNKIFILAGEQATGKTFMVLSMVKQYLQSNPTNMVTFFETEGAIDKAMLEERGLDTNRIIFIPVDSVENFKIQSIKVLKRYEDIKMDGDEVKPKMMFVLDSIGMLASSKELNDALDGKTTADMTRAKTLKSTFRILTLSLAKNDIPMICTNHTYESIGIFAKKSMGGGSGAYFSASTIGFLSKAQIKDGTINTGILVSCKLEKSRLSKEKSLIKFEIDFNNGINLYSGLFDFCESRNIIKKEGRTYFFEGETKADGKAKASIYSDPAAFFTEEKLRTIVEPQVNAIFKYGTKDIFDEE